MSLTLGEASKQSGFAKSSLSKAISKGRLAAVRSENGMYAIDEAELARFVEANVRPIRVDTLPNGPSAQSGTAVDELITARVRADVAEKMLLVLQAQLAEMTAQRDRWERRFDQLKLPAANTSECRSWWRRPAGRDGTSIRSRSAVDNGLPLTTR
jgi:hypothetical protein